MGSPVPGCPGVVTSGEAAGEPATYPRSCFSCLRNSSKVVPGFSDHGSKANPSAPGGLLMQLSPLDVPLPSQGG
jgi:hypothetical protein